jgi:pimeloyl-ACP methyl ester carboxylesterase
MSMVILKYPVSILFIILNCYWGTSQSPKRAETVPVNGTSIYYEVYGKGEPLFLLHGFSFSSKHWLPYTSDFSNDFEVYLIDLRGHGKSKPFSEPLNLKQVAEDIYELAKFLELEKINAIGHSFGGDVIYQLAIMHSDLVKSMITIGSTGSLDINDFTQEYDYLSSEHIDRFEYMWEYQESESQIRAILDQYKYYTVYISNEELRSIRARTLMVFGDNDDGRSLEDIARN